MKNGLIRSFKSKVKLNIKGKNIERFIRRLIKNKIEIISMERIKYNEINIIIFKYDLEKIDEIKTIYKIEIKRYYGIDKIKKRINKNKYILIFIIFGVLLIYFLSNIIFSVEVIHSSKEIRTLVKKELKEYGIDKYHFKKSYEEKEKIKEKILNKYNDKLEWIEIEEYGTKYKIKVEERMINKDKQKGNNQDIVAKKDGIIINVEASNGEIIKNKNDYVKKGDIIISGNLKLNEEIKNQVEAKGKVYAETWYTVDVTFPYHYKEIDLTNNKKTIITIKFLNKYYDLFNLKKYKTKKIKNTTLIKNIFIPFSIIKQNQYETKEIDEIYNKDEVIDKAINKGKNKLLKDLDSDSKVLNYRILEKQYNEKEVKLKIFFTVKENITDYKKIENIPERTELDK